MPIVIKGGGGGTTPPPTQIPEVGYASITYYDPSGRAWSMTDTSAAQFALAEGVSGLGAAPYTLTTDPHPRGGSRLRHAQPQARTIVWPLLVRGSNHTEFTANWRAMAKAFTRTLRDGPGVLEVARPDGTRRRIEVYYAEGFDGRGQHATGITWDSAVITLWCEDPYWEDVNPVSVVREYGGAGEDFFVPYPSVSSGQVLGATTVTNPGDVQVWPEWAITGPASLVTFTNSDSGESFVLDPNATGVAHGALLAGESVTVSTDPPSVRYQDGSNWVASLNWPSAQLWPLPPGETPVTFQLDGASAGSRVDLVYYPRYETP
ncbi:phage tail family protein [Streptomyces lycii]|uniref:Phage tail protein n=1 Tax=Streptomyces lycii TaxID=2654337 RepID=A0ABQ7FN26_9ACTN|nr:phage tail domain-containing protein [Streptomyces lycii]KAF4408653.1 phage tail protein [Streptomyces lycii]